MAIWTECEWCTAYVYLLRIIVLIDFNGKAMKIILTAIFIPVDSYNKMRLKYRQLISTAF